jgi:ribosomal protein L7/L12
MDGLVWVALSFMVVFVGLMLSGVEGKIRRVERKVSRLDRRLDEIVKHLGIKEFDAELKEVDELVRRGERARALKRYREITGVELKEAAKAIRRIETTAQES